MTSDVGRSGRTRADDHATSMQGAIAAGRRAPNLRLRLLVQYREAGTVGLTDEEAAEKAGIGMRSCPWKRSGELRQDRLIEQQIAGGVPLVRKGTSGVDQMVCVVTGPGLAVLRAHQL